MQSLKYLILCVLLLAGCGNGSSCVHTYTVDETIAIVKKCKAEGLDYLIGVNIFNEVAEVRCAHPAK
jgi:uncharacterized lipoprotein YmbA